MNITEFLINILTFWILDKRVRLKIKYALKTRLYGAKILRRAKVGKNFTCMHPSVATKKQQLEIMFT